MEKNFENYQNKVIRLISEKILLNWAEPYKNAENSSSICSGSFISDEGHILTCAHCVDNSKTVFFEIPSVEDNATEIFVNDIAPKEIERVTPKKGRLVLFDGHHLHAGGYPTNTPRCIVNYNLIAGH